MPTRHRHGENVSAELPICTLDKRCASRQSAHVLRLGEMSEPERLDFLAQVALSCDEEAPLRDVPLGSTDLVPGAPVRHGPWSPDDCAEVLKAWFSVGFIGLFRRGASQLDDLGAIETLSVLSHSDLWTRQSYDVCLYTTALGRSRSLDEWLTAVPRT